MAEPQVRYCKTSDGVNIAFAVSGDGPPLVISPDRFATHLQLQLDIPDHRSFFERLAQRVQVIRYDCRGLGMSQRDQIDFSVEAAQRDLSAVVDRLGLERFALYGHIAAGEGPMAFAANNPERVTSLIYWVGQTVAISSEIMRQIAALEPLAETEWDLYCNNIARLIAGWDSPWATPFASVLRAGSSPEARRVAWTREVVRCGFAGDWAARVHVPTLVLHLAGTEGPTDIARTLASSISTAHVVAIPGHPSTLKPFVYDNEVAIAAIADFVGATWADPTAPVRAPELKLSAMRAILWTDIEDHTALMQRLGDSKGRDVLREHEHITREALSANGGTEVKAMGDGFMAWFSSAQQAMECAIALQRAFAARNESAVEPLLVRAGVNAGEPIVEDDDLFGASVIAAARICRAAAGGEIVASDVVRQLVAGKGFLFGDRGAVGLKGFDDAVRLYEVRWRE